MSDSNGNNVEKFLEKQLTTRLATTWPSHLPSIGLDEVLQDIKLEFYRNPKLKQCSPQSICSSILTALSFGLRINGLLGEAYMIAYRDQCQFQIGYQGYHTLLRRCGLFLLTAQVVHEGDKLDYEYGTNQHLCHRPSRQPGTMESVYAYFEFDNGLKVFDVLHMYEIENIRTNSSQAPNSPAWKNFYGEMAKKCAIKRLAKYQSLTPEVKSVLAYEDLGLTGEQPAIEINAKPIGKPPEKSDGDQANDLLEELNNEDN